MIVDGVFAGGGVKAFAFVGALQVMEQKGFTFDRLAGTSAGAIVAALIKVGYTSDEIFELLDKLDIESFKDERMSIAPFTIAKWVHMYYRLGLYKGNELENWLKKVLEAKGVRTFGDLPRGSLRIIASDLTKGKLLVLPDDLEKYGVIPEKFPIARAIRMSCSIPFFFEPVKLYDRVNGGKASYIVDGGLLSNFPMWLFMDGSVKRWKRPAIGFHLKPELSEIPPKKIKNAVTLYRALFETMTSAHDLKYVDAAHEKNVVFIPVLNVKATDFELSDAQKENLIILGKEETNHFLKNWSY